jgi:hypothetical protein
MENYFLQPRRAKLGTHHRINGRLLQAYANERA